MRHTARLAASACIGVFAAAALLASAPIAARQQPQQTVPATRKLSS